LAYIAWLHIEVQSPPNTVTQYFCQKVFRIPYSIPVLTGPDFEYRRAETY